MTDSLILQILTVTNKQEILHLTSLTIFLIDDKQASRLIVIDIPGHGLAPETEPEFSYKPELAVGCCFEAIKHFKIPKFSIVGHSLGGMIALLMALKAPSHINGKQKSTAIKVSVLWFD